MGLLFFLSFLHGSDRMYVLYELYGHSMLPTRCLHFMIFRPIICLSCSLNYLYSLVAIRKSFHLSFIHYIALAQGFYMFSSVFPTSTGKKDSFEVRTEHIRMDHYLDHAFLPAVSFFLLLQFIFH